METPERYIVEPCITIPESRYKELIKNEIKTEFYKTLIEKSHNIAEIEQLAKKFFLGEEEDKDE